MKLHIGKWPATADHAAYWHVMVEVRPGVYINKQVTWTEDYDPEGVIVVDIGNDVGLGNEEDDIDDTAVRH